MSDLIRESFLSYHDLQKTSFWKISIPVKNNFMNDSLKDFVSLFTSGQKHSQVEMLAKK